jgi:hypothetical protein
MMQIVEGLPDNVVGILAKGRVTVEDCRKVLKPAMEHSLSRHDKIRLYYEISSRFPGAAWDDLRIGVKHMPQWERIAIVTDVGWVRHTVNALRFLIPGEVRVFTTNEAYEGCAWISSPSIEPAALPAPSPSSLQPNEPRRGPGVVPGMLAGHRPGTRPDMGGGAATAALTRLS